MKESQLKYLFFTSSGILLLLMLLISSDAGITCDEVLHYDHSVAVYNYFASHGKDLSSLNTPVSQLKYYGQSYDNIVTILSRWLRIDDVYGFRHIMSAFAGWLTIIVTAVFAIWLAGYRTGILVLILFAVSPVFIGHSQNNLKDIPFALGYISSVFFILRFIFARNRISGRGMFFLVATIAFAISIRAGGLLLICYLFFFYAIYSLDRYMGNDPQAWIAILRKILLMLGVSVLAWLLSIILWPFALQDPLRDVLASYRVMAHFPDTFRQIFEGKVEWSDYMPWYYLIKSMAITIPLTVLAGFLLFFLFCKKIFLGRMKLHYFFVLFSLVFPIVFVLYTKSNLYSSWRQFLFVYPSVILLSAAGFNYLIDHFRNIKYSAITAAVVIALLSIHPVKYMAANHRYSYIYYNQFVGGLKGAFGNYETDYYYVSQSEAAGWLIGQLKDRGDTGHVKIKATYSVSWLFRKYPEAETSYFRYEERSMCDWDYAIAVNRYIPPFQLKNNTWPPKNAIHIIYADKVPVCAVLRRESKDDLKGFLALREGRNEDAVKYFGEAVKTDSTDEMIFYNFATALYNSGQHQKADSLLRKGLEVNPDCESILMYLGNIAGAEGRKDDAVLWYGRVISANRKYFEAYVALSQLIGASDIMKARDLLRKCLTINPRYRDALLALAETYRTSDPEIARKYDELAGKLK